MYIWAGVRLRGHTYYLLTMYTYRNKEAEVSVRIYI